MSGNRVCWRVVSFVGSLLILCLSIMTFYTSPVYAGSDIQVLKQSYEDRYKIAKRGWDTCISLGITEECAAGILGNLDAESGFEAATGRWSDGNGNKKTGVCQGNGAGFHQFIGQSSVDIAWDWATEQKLDPDDIATQIKYLFTDEYDYHGSGYNNVYCQEIRESDGHGLASRDEFMKLKDVQKATDAFCIIYERCGGGSTAAYNGKTYQDLGSRREFAQGIYKEFKGSAPSSDLSSGGSDSGSDTDLNMTSLKSAGFTVVGRQLLEETEFYTPDGSLSEGELTLASVDDLALIDRTVLKEWTDTIKYSKADLSFRYPRIAFMFFGIVVVLYSALIYIFYWFDRVNNFIDIELLKKATLGRLTASSGDFISNFEDKDAANKIVVHKDMIFISCTGIALGAFLISGRLFDVIRGVIDFIEGFM